MYSKTINLLLALTILLLNNCSDDKNFFKGTKKTIAFQKQFAVSGEHLDIDSIGIADVTVCGKYLVLRMRQQSHYANIYDLETLKFSGEFLHIGQGPEDVAHVVSIRNYGYPRLELDDWDYRHIKFMIVYYFNCYNEAI
jgi:hypothetical protein